MVDSIMSALTKMRSGGEQLGLSFRTWGGSRGGGRPKSKAARVGVPHRSREALASRHPVHVTLRVRRQIGSLRRQQTLAVVHKAYRDAKNRLGMRVVHFSVQHDHIHMIVEAESSSALSRGVKGFGVRVAKGLNGVLRRKGSVIADRYHTHILKTPREVKNALVYVINNFRKHAALAGIRLGARFDPFSSAASFDGWREGPLPMPAARAGPVPVVPPSTWLLTVGWLRHGKPSLWDVPGPRDFSDQV
jgi:putative transposase